MTSAPDPSTAAEVPHCLPIVRSTNVWTGRRWRSADLKFATDGRVERIADYGSLPGFVHDHGDLLVMPGLVDPHVHFNQPGRTEWEGIASGSAAARAGGITTVVDMPLNSSPVTTTAEAIDRKRKCIEAESVVDMGMHFGLIPENAQRIDGEWIRDTVSVKAFLCPSGIDEFPPVQRSDLFEAMPRIRDAGKILMVHAEVVSEAAPMSDPRSAKGYSATRPPKFEGDAIEMMIELVKSTECPVHVVHLADAQSLPQLRAARDAGLPISVETCPHYLIFDHDTIPDGATEFKCAPPIRDSRNRDELWNGLIDGTIDMIVSDHSPCPPSMKHRDRGRFDLAWGGIASIQLGFSAVWTEASRREIPVERVWQWMSAAPAQLIGGSSELAVGRRANLLVFDPALKWFVDASDLLHRHSVTPYHRRVMTGKVIETYVGGRKKPDPQHAKFIRGVAEA